MDNTGIELGTCFPWRPIGLFPPAFRLTSPILSAAQADESLFPCPFFPPNSTVPKPKSDGTDPSAGEFCLPKTSVLGEIWLNLPVFLLFPGRTRRCELKRSFSRSV